MEQESLLKQIENHREIILIKYPKKQVITNKAFKIIIEMLSIDYKLILPGGKRVKVFKEYMLLWIKQTLESGGSKNYVLDLMNIFKDKIIFDALYSSFGDKSKELKWAVNGTYSRLFAWQGFEGCEWKRIEEIEKLFRYRAC